MARKIPLVTGEVYHIYNRGVRKGEIFFEEYDYNRWEEVLYWCLNFNYTYSSYQLRLRQAKKSGKSAKEVMQDIEREYKLPTPPLKILAYTWMPNHYHLIVKQLVENGISSFMHRIGSSYAKHINEKYEMSGSVFQGTYQAVLVKSDEQLKQVVRYIHVNSLETGLVSKDKLLSYRWSSLPSFVNRENNKLLIKDLVLGLFDDKPERLLDFTIALFAGDDVDVLKGVTIDDDFGWYREEREIKKEMIREGLVRRV